MGSGCYVISRTINTIVSNPHTKVNLKPAILIKTNLIKIKKKYEVILFFCKNYLIYLKNNNVAIFEI